MSGRTGSGEVGPRRARWTVAAVAASAILLVYVVFYSALARSGPVDVVAYLQFMTQQLTLLLLSGFCAFWIILLVHEGSHWLAGVALRLPVESVTVGAGPRLLSVGRVSGAAHGGQPRLDVRLLPSQGCVRFAAALSTRARFRFAVAAAAGPIGNIALWAAAPRLDLSGEALGQTLWGPFGHRVILLTGALSLVLGVLNLLPLTLGGLRTDGRQVVDVLRGKPFGAGPAGDVGRALSENSLDEAVTLARRLPLRTPAPWPMRHLQVWSYYQDKRYADAAAAVLAPVVVEPSGAQKPAEAYNLEAMALLMAHLTSGPRPEVLDRAERASASAHRLRAGDAAVSHTRALALICTGGALEGVPLARRALAMGELSGADRAEVLATVALGQLELGLTSQAEGTAAEASAADGSCPLLPAIYRELEAARRRT